jgi:hypothetical protein
MYRHSEYFLCMLLSNDVLVEFLENISWSRKRLKLFLRFVVNKLLMENVVTKLNTLVADVYTWSRYEFLDFLLRFSAEGT